MNSSEQYYTVFGWMPTELKLKGSEILIFALINSFSNGAEGCYIGSYADIKAQTGLCRDSAIKTINRLIEKNLIVKIEKNTRCNCYRTNFEEVEKIYQNGRKFLPKMVENSYQDSRKNLPEWSKIPTKVVENSYQNGRKFLPNNNSNNIVNDIEYMSGNNKPHTQKKSYGEYQNVQLSDDEYNLLIEQFGNPERLIKRLDEYKEQSGKQYNSDYIAIKNWVVKAVQEDESNKTDIETTYDIDEINRKAMINDDYDI